MNGSIRAYARHRKADGRPGGSHTAVRKAIATGRITAESDGSLNFAKCDRAWGRNSAPAKPEQKPDAKAAAKSKGKPKREPAETVDVVDGESYSDARARREKAEADLAELKYRKESREVLSAIDVKKTFYAIGRMHASARESLPTNLGPKLVGKTDPIEIEEMVRTALREADSRVADEIEKRHWEVVGDGDGSISL